MTSMKTWFEQMWRNEARRATRLEALPLIVYNWDASRPASLPVRDISFRGMYLVTDERWYPNTLIMMTLVRTDTTETDRSIQLMGRIARTGADGVGFEFILLQRPGGVAPIFEVGFIPNRQTIRFWPGFLKQALISPPATAPASCPRNQARAIGAGCAAHPRADAAGITGRWGWSARRPWCRARCTAGCRTRSRSAAAA